MFSKLCICKHDSTENSLEKMRREKKPQISSYHENLKQSSLQPSSSKLQKLERLQEKEEVLRDRISQELDRAKGFIKSQNEQAAIECLKRKKYYEGRLEQLGRFQLLVQNHGARATTISAERSIKS